MRRMVANIEEKNNWWKGSSDPPPETGPDGFDIKRTFVRMLATVKQINKWRSSMSLGPGFQNRSLNWLNAQTACSTADSQLSLTHSRERGGFQWAFKWRMTLVSNRPSCVRVSLRSDTTGIETGSEFSRLHKERQVPRAAAAAAMAKAKSGPLARRPDNSAFKQQRLPAWSPMLTANTVLPFFYFMAVICLLLGIWLLLTVQSVREVRVDYTENGACAICHDMRKNASNAALTCPCKLRFTVDKALKGDVFFYYSLQNFHQNLRRYMDSRDDAQMVGRKTNLKKPSSYCKPFATNDKGLPIAPCGAVANSIFNDSFKFQYLASGRSEYAVPLLRKGISWYTDKNIKYRNPQTANLSLAAVFQGTAPPPYWHKPVYALDTHDDVNNGFINEDLIVWMREAAFPNFKKLYGVLDRANRPFQSGLPKGNYTVEITYNFPVQYFRGRKQVVLTTLNWFGGPNQFLPIAYLITSSLVLLAAVGLTVVWWKFGKDGKNMDE